jgi:hypothetical protein
MAAAGSEQEHRQQTTQVLSHRGGPFVTLAIVASLYRIATPQPP